MWDDADIEEETKPAVAQEPEAGEAVAEGAAAAAEGAAEPDAVVKGTEPEKLIFRHWVRPKFLQYGYMYDYRHNYYDDMILYLDRRNKGLPAEKPGPQTWAERAVRTNVSKMASTCLTQAQKDSTLLRHISSGARFHRYHSKSLISRKYSNLGFNIVSI